MVNEVLLSASVSDSSLENWAFLFPFMISWDLLGLFLGFYEVICSLIPRSLLGWCLLGWFHNIRMWRYLRWSWKSHMSRCPAPVLPSLTNMESLCLSYLRVCACACVCVHKSMCVLMFRSHRTTCRSWFLQCRPQRWKVVSPTYTTPLFWRQSLIIAQAGPWAPYVRG